MERNVVIVMARCCQFATKGFGMRMERRAGNQWLATWAFAIKEKLARKEGFDKTHISGAFGIHNTYPGCPHCNAKYFFKCGGCNHVACHAGELQKVICPWCHQNLTLSGPIESLNAGADR